MPGPGASTVDELIAGAAAAAGLGQAPAGDDIDRVIRMAEAGIRVPPPGQASVAGGRGAPAEEGATGPPEAEDDEAGGAAGGKKKKDKSGRMVYADSDVSPEEKLAEMPRYRWVEA